MSTLLRSKRPSPILSALTAITVSSTAACGGYTSEYEPPADGRPRLVWRDDGPVAVMANKMPEECAREVDSLLSTGALPSDAGSSTSSGGTGPDVGGGGVRIHGPTLATGHFWTPTHIVALPRLPFVPVPHPILSFSSGGSGSGKLDMKGGDLGEGIVYLLAIAVIALPFITLSLAVSRPEPEASTASEIDYFNAQTDLARVQGSACDEVVVAAEGNR